MVFTILEVSSLDLEISVMEVVRAAMASLAFPTIFLASNMMPLAWLAFSAFCLIMADISSRAEEVSSMEAA